MVVFDRDLRVGLFQLEDIREKIIESEKEFAELGINKKETKKTIVKTRVPLIKILSKEFLDSFSVNSNNLIGTYNGFKKSYDNNMRIDYIFSKGLDLKSFEHVPVKTLYGGWASDHHPIISKSNLVLWNNMSN